MRRWISVLVFLLGCFGLPTVAQAEKRVALVIGNGAYQTVANLPNPAGDAKAMGELFKAAGFDDVTVKTDLGVVDMRRELREFARKVVGADIATVYYAGHGIEVGGHNYLVPIDAKLEYDTDAEDEAIDLDHVLQQLEPAKRLKLVILDACRENPFAPRMRSVGQARDIGRGLAPPVRQGADTLVAYAAAAGATAADGSGVHSPFTAALLHDLTRPGLDVRLALGKVRDDVLQATDNRQTPFITGSLGGDNVSLAPTADNALPQPTAPVAPATPTRPVPPPAPTRPVAIVPPDVPLRAPSDSDSPPEPAPAACGGNSDEALSAPVRNLFAALVSKNLTWYSEQWDESATWKNSQNGEVRDKQRIVEKKSRDFQRWSRVDARIANLKVLQKSDMDAWIEDYYVMTIQGQRGVIHDKGREQYHVQCQSDGRWRIVENLDYSP